MGASALVKQCADQDDLDEALEVFYKMTSTRTTFNRWARVQDMSLPAINHASTHHARMGAALGAVVVSVG